MVGCRYERVDFLPRRLKSDARCWLALLPPHQRFELECEYSQYPDASKITDDLSDYTGYDVFLDAAPVDKGYWYVSLANDEECYEFAKKYKEYCDARQRISTALFGCVLVLTQEQHGKVKKIVELYDKMVVGNHVLIAVPADETTKRLIAILDALGM